MSWPVYHIRVFFWWGGFLFLPPQWVWFGLKVTDVRTVIPPSKMGCWLELVQVSEPLWSAPCVVLPAGPSA